MAEAIITPYKRGTWGIMTREEREKAIDALKMSVPIKALTQEEFNNYIQILNKIMDCLEKEPKTGHWILSDDGLYRPICDKCGAHPWKGYIPTVEEATEVFKYCPNCGTKMVEPQESEEV